MPISDDDLKTLCAIHRKTGGRDFEPTQPNHPFVLRMIDAGLMERRDGRCMFERIRDAFLAFTEAGYRTVAEASRPDPVVTPSP